MKCIYESQAVPTFIDSEQYIEKKLTILKRDFKVHPTKEELAHLHSLKTEESINKYCVKIIDNYWERKGK